jgi:hypothetical protein
MSFMKRAARAAFLAAILVVPSVSWAQEYVGRRQLARDPIVDRAMTEQSQEGSSPKQSGKMELPSYEGSDLPPPVDYSTRTHLMPMHAPRSDCESFDVVGSYLDRPSPTLGRPGYPYNNGDIPWEAQDADPESWSDLGELPYVQLGWHANVDTNFYYAKVYNHLRSHTLLDGAFPGDPIDLGIASLDPAISPRIELGYRYERGLGEARFGYQYYGFDGIDTIAGYDPGGLATRTSSTRGHVFDLDLCYLEFNSAGLPLFIPPLFKVPGRLSLGRRLAPRWFASPLEVRITMGGRGANFYTDSMAVGPTTTDRAMSNFWGGGLHWVFDLDQRVHEDSNLFLHARAEGSGTFGTVHQTFTRTRGGVTASAVEPPQWLGVPTVGLELGMKYSPDITTRNLRFTAAYHYEQVFSYAQTTASTLDWGMNGVLFRGEYKY